MNSVRQGLKWTEFYSGLRVNNQMMTSSNGSIFRFTGHLWGESTGNQWILLGPMTRSFDDLRPNKTVGETIETPVIWDVIALIMTSL